MTAFTSYVLIFLCVMNNQVFASKNKGVFSGDFCNLKALKQIGMCVVFEHCQYAIDLVADGGRPKSCGFKGQIPIVCCPFDYIIKDNENGPITTTTTTTTTVRTTSVSTRETTQSLSTEKTVASTSKTTLKPATGAPLVSTSVGPKTAVPGEKSIKKCLQYFPKEEFHKFVFGGTKSLAKEFPHMAILGFGPEDSKTWACGGSLISELFVLTAAHCVRTSELGNVTWVRLGDLDINNKTDDASPQDFRVLQISVHPLYRSSSHYHDVAILKLDRKARFDDYVKPACLHTDKTIDKEEKLQVTGWGKVDFAGDSSSHLLKAEVEEVPIEECKKHFETVFPRKLKSGIESEWQICAGQEDGRDTCPGDSGGPLQYKTFNGQYYYHVVGVTSFGKACGVKNSAGVYVRVSYYLDWIEDILWPSD